MRLKKEVLVKAIYEKLLKEFGPQHWWPADTRMEVIVGAILTQNTNWKNVEKAIRNLKQHHEISIDSLRDISLSRLSALIRPSGYFNIKAKRLKNFINFLVLEYGGDLDSVGEDPLLILRKKFLKVNGIGPETADSILLYAFGKNIFVIDSYAKRIFSRHHIVSEEDSYERIQKVFMKSLDADAGIFNEYHALIVQLAKKFCKTTPQCESCPINSMY